MRLFASLALVAALVSPAWSQTGSVKTQAALNTETNTLWPDNTVGQITPFNARQTLLDVIATSFAFPNIANNYTAVQTYGADAYFGSGRPWCDPRSKGALGDQTTDDTTAFTACVTALSVIGGTVFVSPGNYCIKGGWTVSGLGLNIMGAGRGGVLLQTCGADVTLLTLNATRSVISDIGLAGPNTLATTHDTLVLGAGCVECVVDRVFGVQGRYVLNDIANDTRVTDSTLQNSYGNAIVYVNGQFYGKSLKLDQIWPVSTPARQAAFPARTNTTGYTTGQVVTTACVTSQGVSCLIQATNNGTSAGSAPTVLPYNQNITDGTVVWKFAAPATFFSAQIDTASSVVTMSQTDFSGPFTYSVAMTNSLAGVVPTNLSITDSFFFPILGGFHGVAGAGVHLKGNQIANCITNGCTGILFDTSWTGDMDITSNYFINNPLALYMGNPAAINASITGNLFFGSTSAAITLACNNAVGNVSIVGNQFGVSASWGTNAVGVLFNGAGTCDNIYGIPTNQWSGATTPFSFSGGAILGNHTDGYPAVGYAVAKAVNFNSANTDTAIQIPLPPGAVSYLVNNLKISNASQTLTTATFGLFTQVTGGGTAIFAAGQVITVSTAAAGAANNSQANVPATASTQSYAPGSSTPASTLQFRVGTPQGATAIGDVMLELRYIY